MAKTKQKDTPKDNLPDLSFLFTKKGLPEYSVLLELDDNTRSFCLALFPKKIIKSEIKRLYKKALKLKSNNFLLPINISSKNKLLHKKALIKRALAKFFCISEPYLEKILSKSYHKNSTP